MLKDLLGALRLSVAYWTARVARVVPWGELI